MIKNSRSRLMLRRKGALDRTEKHLKQWNGKLSSAEDKETVQRKIVRCETDITNLKKKIGNG